MPFILPPKIISATPITIRAISTIISTAKPRLLREVVVIAGSFRQNKGTKNQRKCSESTKMKYFCDIFGKQGRKAFPVAFYP